MNCRKRNLIYCLFIVKFSSLSNFEKEINFFLSNFFYRVILNNWYFFKKKRKKEKKMQQTSTKFFPISGAESQQGKKKRITKNEFIDFFFDLKGEEFLWKIHMLFLMM